VKFRNGEGILFEIGDSVKESLESRKRLVSKEKLIYSMAQARKPFDFSQHLLSATTAIIAEVKFRSPSQGDLTDQLDPLAVAESYLKNGATALSVLTEEKYFKGSLSYLKAIRQKFPQCHLLMKDFIIDEYQLLEGKLAGADAVLLIVALLAEEKLIELYDCATTLGLSILVEVHNENELEIARRLNARLIGVNNRDLKTLKISLETSRHLIGHAPKGALMVCESGLETADQIKEMKSLGFRGFLMGSSLMKTGRPGETLADILREIP